MQTTNASKQKQQPSALTQLTRSSDLQPFNLPNYSYTVPLSPEHPSVRPLLEQNVPPQYVERNTGMYRAVPMAPSMLPDRGCSESAPTRPPHVESVLPFPSSDNPFTARVFVEHLIKEGKIEIYAIDKQGSRFLQKVFIDGGANIRQKLTDYFLKLDVFTRICDDTFGNFLLQKMIEKVPTCEHKRICSMLETDLVVFSRGRYSCRVVQKAFECFDVTKCLALLNKLDGAEIELTTDQNGNHVIQKIFTRVPLDGYSKIVKKYVAKADVFSDIVKCRYGCRVMQLSIKKLEEEVDKNMEAASLLDKIISMLLGDCQLYSAHQYANYVIQHIIASNTLQIYRNKIIRHLLSNLLVLSQEKYASHVVEKALQCAPPELLRAMMSEFFDGYERDRKGQDAIDILLFDQFGNYVAQTMLEISLEIRQKKREGDNSWFVRLAERIIRSQNKLMRYSSGKRILEKLSAAVSSEEFANQEENLHPAFKFLVIPKKFH